MGHTYHILSLSVPDRVAAETHIGYLVGCSVNLSEAEMVYGGHRVDGGCVADVQPDVFP